MDNFKLRISAVLFAAILCISYFTPSIASVANTKSDAASNSISAKTKLTPTSNVGTLKGDFQVTPTGQAHYTIPIDVPPGTAKMQPALSIAYDSTSSNTHNGPLGMGFSIEGLTAITRCNSNKTLNGLIHGVDFTDQDRFCLNGEQLVAVKGAYGADGTEYRTYIDSKAKIVSYGRVGNGPAKFTVWTKGGQIATYGETPDSQIYAQGKPTIATWALTQITDTVGNYLTVRYLKDDANGAFYPHTVNYTGNAPAHLAPYYSVEFNYEARPDKVESYTAGSVVRIVQRLKNIQVKNITPEKIISSYNFTYEISPNSYRSRITSIQKCGSDGVCLPPTRFTWQTNEEGWDNAPQFKPPTSGHGSDYVNLSGTGTPDLVLNYFYETKSPDPDTHSYGAWLNNGAGWIASEYATAFVHPHLFEIWDKQADEGLQNYGGDAGTRFVDLLGSGHDDIVQNAFYGQSVSLSGALMNNGNRWVSAPAGYIPKTRIADQGRDCGVRFISLYGNGRPDLVQHVQVDASNVWASAWINTGEGFTQIGENSQGVNGIVPPLQISNFNLSFGTDTGTRFIDLRGIGLDDEIGWGFQFPRATYLNTGNGWVLSDPKYLPPVEIANQGRDGGVRFVHLTTSGLPDMVQSVSYSTKDYQDVRNSAWINTGAGWVQDTYYNIPGNTISWWDDLLGQMKDGGVRFVDLRGTGLDDIAENTILGHHVYINNGSKWVEDPNYKLPVFTSIIGFETNFRFVDLTGSGLPDITRPVLLGTPGAWLNKAQKYPDYLISITDGLGATLEIDYEALSIKNPDIKVYTKEHDAQYPYMDYQGPMYVVYKTITTSDINDPNVISKILAKNNVTQSISSCDQAQAKPSSGAYNYICEQRGELATKSQLEKRRVYRENALDHTTWYHYTGAKMHHLGFGFVGFHKVTTTDQSTGISKTVTYGQDASLHNIGEELASETHLANGTLISASQNTWETRAFGDGKPNTTYYQNNTKRVITRTFDLTGLLSNTKTEDFVVDDFGNATKIATTLQDNTGTFTTVNENTFKNDPNAWLIGALSTSVVTVSAPNKTTNKRTAYFTYDPVSGLLLSETTSPDNPKFETTTSYLRDAFGNIKQTTVAGNGIETRVSSVEYDTSTGRFAVKATNPLGQSTTQEFDPILGLITKSTDLNGFAATYQYDGFGRLVETDYPDATKENVSFAWAQGTKDAVYSVTTTKTNAPTKVSYFDSLSRPVASTTQGLDGRLIWTLTQYDELGRITNQSIPYFDDAGAEVLYINNEYDVLGHKTKITNPDKTTTTFTYSGNTTTITNALKQKTIKTFDARNNLITVTDNLNKTTHYDYDQYGNLVTLTDSLGNITKIVYDQYGRKTDVYDPDKGHWSYTYDVLGQLITQKDGSTSGNLTTLTYDKLGRMTKRVDPAGTSTWEYDGALHGIGKLSRVTGIAGIDGKNADITVIHKSIQAGLENYSKTFTYEDKCGRLSQAITTINGQPYTSSYSYDKDRLDVETYPNGIQVKHNYNPYGYLVNLSDAQSGKKYWTLNNLDALGHVISETRSNGLITNYTYNPKTNLLTDINTVLSTTLEAQQRIFPTQTGLTVKHQHINQASQGKYVNKKVNTINALENKIIQREQYGYDLIGNVTSHKDVINNLTESYQFDDLNRITQANVGSQVQTFKYDDIGNIIYKSDVGTYTYSKSNAGPHAVTGITDSQGKTIGNFAYNTNGDQVQGVLNGVQRIISYTSFSKPLSIVIPKTGTAVNFYYNADRDAFERQDHSSTKNVTTYYLGDYELAKIDNGKSIITEQKAYIGPNTINITRLDSSDSKNNSNTIYEVLHDNLGSTTDIVDQNANIVQHFTYTPFGEQKQTKGQVLDNPITHKGFTGHEEIEGMNLIHMGGRIYDPILGRFLSADPTIEAPADPQDLNRYSYCINNPLKYVDSNGYGFWGSLGRSIEHAYKSARDFVKNFFNQKIVQTVLQIAVGVFCPQLAPLLAAAMTAAAGGNFVDILKAAALMELNIKAWGVVGDLTEGLTGGGWFTGLGDFAEHALSTTVHGIAGGALSCLEGGNFKDGFLGAAVGEACAGSINNLPKLGGGTAYMLERAAAAGVIGGTASALGGGNFVTGAATAAFSEMYNHFPHENRKYDSRTLKESRTLLSVGALQIDVYYTKTIEEGSSNIEQIYDIDDINPLSAVEKGTLYNITTGQDGSITYGTDTLSLGSTANGRYIEDFSIHIGKYSIGTTSYYNPSGCSYVMRSIGNFLARTNPASIFPIFTNPGLVVVP